MKSEKQLKRKWFMYKLFSIAMLFPRMFAYARNRPSNITKKDEFKWFCFFDTLDSSIESGRIVEYISTGAYTTISIDNSYVLRIWDANRPYADMGFDVYDLREHNLQNFDVSFIEISRESEPSFALAWKMRKVCDMLKKSKNQPKSEDRRRYLEDAHFYCQKKEVSTETIDEIKTSYLLEVI